MDKSTADDGLSNADLLPTTPRQRTWDWVSFASLWVAMVVCVPTYTLASSQINLGMNWLEAVGVILLGNIIVLVPMVMIGHAGAKFGVPFPVLLRASFGPTGAKLPAIARGLVACGWFGINTWIGGSAIYQIINVATGGALVGTDIPGLGIDPAQFACFLLFWVLHVWFIMRGTESIRWLEMLAAPLLMIMSLMLLVWAYVAGGGFGEILAKSDQFNDGLSEARYWEVFIFGLTSAVGFWATMALNIPDFTRFARSQKDQMLGQLIGLPLPMAFITFVGVVVTAATVGIYGEAIWDPVQLAGRMGGFGVVVALFALIIATLSTNLAANVVAPAYGFANLAPSKISFRLGGYITAGIGIAIFPWKLMENSAAYVFTWLVGYSALLGPIAGIIIADYFIVRRCQLDVDQLFKHHGHYRGAGGWNLAGIGALVIGILPNMPGFLVQVGGLESTSGFFSGLYQFAWFVGFFVAAIAYLLLSPAIGTARHAPPAVLGTQPHSD